MKWEELKVYEPLTKEELKPAFKAFTAIVADNLKPFGFTQHGRKIIALSKDLLHIIHIDTRGSWFGVNEYFKTEISLCAVSDKLPVIRKIEPTGGKGIEEIAVGIRDSYRMTKEYELLADFLSRKIVETVMPYFAKYDDSLKILNDLSPFVTGAGRTGNDSLVLHCELQNRQNRMAGKIVDQTLAFYKSIGAYNNHSGLLEYFEEMELFRDALQKGDWLAIEEKLARNKMEIFKKLRIKNTTTHGEKN
jgi:hypothetical protein